MTIVHLASLRSPPQASFPVMSLSEFKLALSAAKHIVVLAGPGLAAASGIPTYRPPGVEGRYEPLLPGMTSQFYEVPEDSTLWQFFHYRRVVAGQAQPNAAHRAIALLASSQEQLHRIAPHAQSFVFITQNVDNLFRRALPPDAPSTADPIEMHGNIFHVRCPACEYRACKYDNPICPVLDGTEKFFKRHMKPKRRIKRSKLPKCPKCKCLILPHVIWPGKPVHRLDDLNEIVEKKCDFMLLVGNSYNVYPGMPFASMAKLHGAKVAVFNTELKKGDDRAHFLFVGPCEVELPRALGVEHLI